MTHPLQPPLQSLGGPLVRPICWAAPRINPKPQLKGSMTPSPAAMVAPPIDTQLRAPIGSQLSPPTPPPPT